jgi:hypothetical protein
VRFSEREEKELFIKPSEFLNRKIREVLPKDIAEKTIACIKKVLESRQPELFEYELKQNGSAHVYEARLAVSSENEVLAIVRDVTSRTETLKAERK